MSTMIFAKNKFTGAGKKFSEEVWNRLPRILKNGKVHDRQGWVKTTKAALDEAAEAAIQKAEADAKAAKTAAARAAKARNDQAKAQAKAKAEADAKIKANAAVAKGLVETKK